MQLLAKREYDVLSGKPSAPGTCLTLNRLTSRFQEYRSYEETRIFHIGGVALHRSSDGPVDIELGSERDRIVGSEHIDPAADHDSKLHHLDGSDARPAEPDFAVHTVADHAVFDQQQLQHFDDGSDR